MRLAHLNLVVADRAVAMAWYRSWFGFDRVLAEYSDGSTFVTNEDGFELALKEGTPAPDDSWHFGFIAPTGEDVRDLASRMVAAGIPLSEREDTGAYVGFKCTDPDGHPIEVYCESRPA